MQRLARSAAARRALQLRPQRFSRRDGQPPIRPLLGELSARGGGTLELTDHIVPMAEQLSTAHS
jgi:hypothetical protein